MLPDSSDKSSITCTFYLSSAFKSAALDSIGISPGSRTPFSGVSGTKDLF
jgi:hypothetical protein